MKAAALIKKEIGVESKVCRWCLSKCEALEPLTNDESGQYKLQQLFDCTGFQANALPGVPSFLCTNCESRLDKMYAFRWRCNKNIALVNGFTEKQNTVKNEADISTDHLGHSAEETVGTELFIKTEATTPDAANDLHLIQRSCTVPHVNGTHECCGNQTDDLFEAEENPIAFKLENADVDEQDNSPTSELICHDREDPPATTNTCVNDSPSELIRNGIAEMDEEKTLHRLRSYNLRSRQQVDSGRNRNTVRKSPCRKQKHPCPHCSATYIRPSQLKIHIRTHTDVMPYACNNKSLHRLRSYNFRSRQQVDNGRNRKAHSKGHRNKGKHHCPHCSATYIRPSHLKIHIRTHTGEKPYACEICDQTFRCSSNLTEHKKIHNKDEYQQCPHCPLKFPRLDKFKDHVRIHTGEKPFVCKICKKAFHSSTSLSYHSKTHKKDEYKQCPNCPSKFALSSTLKNHIRIHTGKKPFVCTICKKAFHSSSALSLHSKIHKKDKYQQCPHCPLKFPRLDKFKDHVRIHTGEKPFVCKICKKAFHSSTSLSYHSKTHKKDEYKQCPNCPSKFAQSSKLKEHIRVHTGEKPFVCKICKKAFYSSSALSHHSKCHKKN